MQITPVQPTFKGAIYFNTKKVPFHMAAQEQVRNVMDVAQTADMKIIDQNDNIALFFASTGSHTEKMTAEWLNGIEGIKIKYMPEITKKKEFVANVLGVLKELRSK